MEILRRLRKEFALTQKQVAEDIGVSPQSYGYYENGINKPDPQTLIKLADYFEVSIDYLLGREDDFGNINVAAQLTDQLTADERELLSCFNATDFAGREALLISARALAGKKEKIKK